MKRVVLSLVIGAVTFFSVGCPRYDQIRALSTEQLAMQEKQLETKQAYFAAIDRLLDQQVIVAYVLLDSETQNQISNRNQKLMLQLATAADDGVKQALIAAASKDIAAYSADDATKKQQIAEHVTLIKNKHQEIMDADKGLYAAQVEINRWVQLKQIDEVVADQVLNKLKNSQQASTAATKTATSTMTDLVKITGGAK